MNSISVPVLHPAFERLKNSGRLLHLIAALLLIAHAFSHLGLQANPIYFWCQLIFAVDILLLVFVGRNLLQHLPKVNAFFRFIEFLFFFGISLIMMIEYKWVTGIFHLILSGVYIYLFYCERKLSLRENEAVSIHHTGVAIPGLPENKFLLWSQINDLKARYDSMIITTSHNQELQFDFRQNLSFEELDQIHEFCRHYLGNTNYHPGN